jgi:predicted ABC-type transport system involved in lysophospholipase L1 biosynthesis ATPase subunit
VDVTIEAAPIATHDMELAARMDRPVTLQEGRVVEMA